MFDIGSDIGSVNVVTSQNGGLSNDQIAEIASNKIIYVSDEAPEPIRQQAEALRTE